MIRSLPIWLCTAGIALTQVASDSQELRGEAVAISALPISMNGNSYAEIVVRSANPNDHDRLILVRLSIPTNQFNQWKAALPSIRTFKINRAPGKDSILKEFFSVHSEPPQTSGDENQKVPAWIPLDVRKRLALPFGNRIPVFQSKDWPEVPVV